MLAEPFTVFLTEITLYLITPHDWHANARKAVFWRNSFIYLKYLWMQQLLLWQNHLSMDSQPLHCAKCNYTSNPSRKAIAALHNSRETWLISSWLMCNISWLVFHREWLPLCNYSMHGGLKHPRKGQGKWHKRHITKWELTGKIVCVKGSIKLPWEFCGNTRKVVTLMWIHDYMVNR